MSENESDYYNELNNRAIQRIIEIVQLLAPDRIIGEDQNTIYIDCPCHSSKSKRSFHIDKRTGLFNCFGCGIKGNIIHLTELLQTGGITCGTPISDTHRQARDWLADFEGMERLSKLSSHEDAQAIEEREREKNAVFAALTDLADFYKHKTLEMPDVIDFVERQWGYGREDIEKYKIGFSNNDGLIDYLADERGHRLFDIAATGAFWPIIEDDKTCRSWLTPHFQHRVIFPYFDGGKVVYMAGRQTPWTPDNKYEQAKYKKLPVWRDQENRRHISKHIINDIPYNADVLHRPLDYIVITEGLADAIALDRIGIPAISPATTTFSKSTHDKLIRLLSRIPRIYIANDNETGQAGLQGALRTGALLEQAGLDVRIVKLPL